MAAIWQTIFSDFFLWKFLYFGYSFTEIFHKGPIVRKSVLLQVMAWCLTGTKPLPEPKLTKRNSKWHHQASLRIKLSTWWSLGFNELTHLALVLQICISEVGEHWFRQWLGAEQATSHYLNQCWFIVNWALRNTLQLKLNQNSNIFIEENAFENVCKMVAILSSRGRWVKDTLTTENIYRTLATTDQNFLEMLVIYLDKLLWFPSYGPIRPQTNWANLQHRVVLGP